MAITMDGIFVNGQKATFHPEDILSGDASAYTEEIGTAVEAWMEENVTGGEQVTDMTLTLPGVPADAKKTGDEIGALKEDLTNLGDPPRISIPEETEADLYICDSQGNVLSKFADGHFKTKKFDSRTIGSIMDTSETDADLYVCDSFGNVVAEFANGHIKTKNFDSEDFSEEILQEVQEELGALANDVSALQTATTGVMYRNKDVIDGIYAACRWHQRTSADKQFCILMGGDIHNDKARMANMIEVLNAVDAFDAGIMLGDIGAYIDNMSWYTEAISKANKPFVTVVGNHDAGSDNGNLVSNGYVNVHDFYAKFIEPNLPYADLLTGEHVDDNVYYYKDFVDQKIRIICLNQYDYPLDNDGETFVYTRGNNCYGQAQITWLCNTLLSTPTDYGVIIAVHSFVARMLIDKTNPWVSDTCATGRPNDLMDYETDGYIIPQIVDAWQNGTSLVKTFRYTVSGSWTSVSVNVDFSSRGSGEFISYIGGHWHMSVMTNVYDYPNQKAFHVECTGLGAAKQGDVPRKEGTKSEDCICALAIDRDKKTVKLFYIGAHFTKDAVDRLYGKYSYATV